MGTLARVFITDLVIFGVCVFLWHIEDTVGEMPGPWSLVVGIAGILSVCAIPVLAILAVWL